MSLTRPKTWLSLASLFVTTGLAKKGDMADKVDSQFFEIDENVKDMLWCGNDNEAIIV